ncbi:MAG: N-acetylglucosamine kinase, partial [Gemmatimonadales bacterium]
ARALERAGVAARVRIVMDVEVALRAAFGRGPGILLNAGTGAIAVAHDSQGALRRAGGYGWQLGDEGGGYWMGRRALAAVGRAQDGRGDAGALPQRLLGALGLAAFDDLVAWSTIATPAQVAQLATEVLAAARDGDPAAGALLAQAARELASLIHALERWFASDTEVPVVLTGGLLGPSSPLRRQVRDAVSLAMPRAQLREGDVDPVAGAVELAGELLS